MLLRRKQNVGKARGNKAAKEIPNNVEPTLKTNQLENCTLNVETSLLGIFC